MAAKAAERIKTMAKIIENEKGFKVIQISRGELLDKLADYGAVGICDRCNVVASTGFYIAVLNMWYCPECYQDWYNGAVRYQEDVAIENKNFEFYKNMFGV